MVTQQQVVRIKCCEVRHLFDIALGDKQVEQTVVVYVIEFCMPAGRRFKVITDIRSVCGCTFFPGDIPVLWPAVLVKAIQIKLLQFGVAHGGQCVFRITIGVQIGTGDAHPPDHNR